MTGEYIPDIIENNERLNMLWEDLSIFVLEKCYDRPESHGWGHAKSVAITSVEIFADEYFINNGDCLDIDILELVIISAWLHDVYDHKYDHDGKLKEIVYDYLKEISDSVGYDIDYELIMNIIDRISFSKENKQLMLGLPLDFEEVLGVNGCLVRNIVSDADKLEAIGKAGLHRCIAYTKEKNPEINDDTLFLDVRKHMEEKLLRISTEFMRTTSGKSRAEILHEEMIEESKKLNILK